MQQQKEDLLREITEDDINEVTCWKFGDSNYDHSWNVSITIGQTRHPDIQIWIDQHFENERHEDTKG